jgi:hypothetical protein
MGESRTPCVSSHTVSWRLLCLDSCGLASPPVSYDLSLSLQVGISVGINGIDRYGGKHAFCSRQVFAQNGIPIPRESAVGGYPLRGIEQPASYGFDAQLLTLAVAQVRGFSDNAHGNPDQHMAPRPKYVDAFTHRKRCTAEPPTISRRLVRGKVPASLFSRKQAKTARAAVQRDHSPPCRKAGAALAADE